MNNQLKQFDELVDSFDKSEVKNYSAFLKLRDFLKQALQEQKEEITKIIEGMKIEDETTWYQGEELEMLKIITPSAAQRSKHFIDLKMGYNQALDDVIKKLIKK